MAIGGIGQNYYQNNVETKRNTKNVNGTEKFALEKTGSTQELSEAEEMELFKKEFYQELSQITTHATVSNAAVNVTEAAFKRMKDDPEYKQQVLSWIKHDLGASYGSRNASVMLTVGETLEQCRGDAWPVSADSEFGIRSQDSFYKSSNERKERQKELLEEYLQKRQAAKQIQQELLDEKIAKAEQERSRLAKAWAGERQMEAASNAYDANVMRRQRQAVIRCLVNEGHHARTYRKGAWAAPNDRGAAADKRNETFLRAGSYYQQMAGSFNLWRRT